MSALFASDDMFEIVVKYIEVKLKSGMMTVRVLDELTEKGKEEIQRRGESVKELHTSWVQPSWKQSNELLRKCTKYDPEAGKKDLDWPLYRGMLLESYMRKWDIAGEDTKPIPCTKQYIDKLDPAIAVALVDQFFDRTSISEEEMGN